MPGEDYADFVYRIKKDCGRACLDQQIEDYENGDRNDLDNQEVRHRTNEMVDEILDNIELDDYFDDDGTPTDTE